MHVHVPCLTVQNLVLKVKVCGSHMETSQSQADDNYNSHMEKSTDTKVAVCKFLDFIPRYVP